MADPVDPATGGEPPLVEPPAPEPEAPDPDAMRIEAVLSPLKARIETDGILAAEVAPFIEGPWVMDGYGAVRAECGQRYCKVDRDQVEIGHSVFKGSKRIPL